MTSTAEHFDALYRDRADPWNYETSGYERRKYDATLAGLTRPRYGDAIEAGCSIGVLTDRLARCCDRLRALDFSPLAVARAAVRLATLPHVEVLRATLPADWPRGRYDLIMLSEILYYLPGEGIDAMARLVARDAAEAGECVLVHWQGETQTEISANDARDRFCAGLARRRPFRVIVHADGAAYDHRTLLFKPEVR